jgi:tetratricopeptide (TPR) repeat protein
VLTALARHDEAAAAAVRWLDYLESTPGTEPAVLAGAYANLGTCFEDAGRNAEALEAHQRASDLAAHAGDRTLVALVEINRSNSLNRLGRSTEALAGLTAATVVLEDEGLTEDLATAAINAGETACLLGAPDAGLAWFHRAAALVEPDSDDACVVLVESAAALLALGSVAEAVERARAALAILADRPVGWLEGRAWFELGIGERALGHDAAAADAFAAASQCFAAASKLAGEVQADLELASLGVIDGTARTERLLAAVDQGAWPLQAALVRLRLADSCGEDGRRRALLEQAVEAADRSGVPHVRYRARHRLGVQLCAAGDVEAGAEHLGAAVELIEQVRRRLSNEAVLRSLPSSTAEVFGDLVRARLRLGQVGEALAVADRARSRVLSELGTEIAPAGADPDIVRLEADLDALYDQLLGVGTSVAAEDRRRIDGNARALEAELQRRRFDLGARSRRIAPAAGDAEDAALVLLFDLDGDDVGLFVAGPGSVGPRHYPNVAKVGAVMAELEGLHAAGRRALALGGVRGSAPAAGALVMSARAVDARLDRLGELLPDKVWAQLDTLGDVGVVVVPEGPLHAVPFAALRREGRSLVDRCAVGIPPHSSSGGSAWPATATGRPPW